MSTRREIIIALGVVIVGVFVGVLIIGVVAYRLYSNSTRDGEMVFAPTEVGTPAGNKVTKDIGPEGGTLVSPDGRLTLTVPQNALTETVPFSIQPVTSKFETGLGLSYRLEPEGKTFATPVDISVHYDDHDLEGTFPEAFKYVSVSKIVVKGGNATLILSFGEDGALAKALPFSDTPNQTFHLQAHNWKV
jgi:hypothetical protein